MTAPTALILFDFNQEYLAGQKRLLAERDCIRETFLAIRDRIVVGQLDVLAVIRMEADDVAVMVMVLVVVACCRRRGCCCCCHVPFFFPSMHCTGLGLFI